MSIRSLPDMRALPGYGRTKVLKNAAWVDALVANGDGSITAPLGINSPAISRQGELNVLEPRFGGVVGENITPAILKAIAEIGPYGSGKICIPGQNGGVSSTPYLMDARVPIRYPNIHIYGDGRTTLRPTFAGDDVFSLGEADAAVSNIEISNLIIHPTVSRLSGANIAIWGGICSARRIWSKSGYLGVRVNSSGLQTGTNIEEVVCEYNAGSAFVVGDQSTAGNMPNDIFTRSCVWNNSAFGIDLRYANGIVIRDSEMYHNGSALITYPASGQTVSFVTIDSSYHDSSTALAVNITTNGGTVGDIYFSKSAFDSNGGVGVAVNGSGIKNVAFSDCQSGLNHDEAFWINAEEVDILNCLLNFNSRAGSASKPGVTIKAGSKRIRIRNSKIGGYGFHSTAAITEYQSRPIAIESGADKIELIDNRYYGHVTADAILDGGATNLVNTGNGAW